MWLHFFAFQCLVDKHLTQRHTGVGWYLPKGRYCVSLGQNIRFEWGPLQMIHFSLGVVLVGHPSVFLFVCLFACSVCFCLPTLGIFLLLPLSRPRPRFMSPIMTSWSGSAGGGFWVGGSTGSTGLGLRVGIEPVFRERNLLITSHFYVLLIDWLTYRLKNWQTDYILSMNEYHSTFLFVEKL